MLKKNVPDMVSSPFDSKITSKQFYDCIGKYTFIFRAFNSLPSDEFLDWSKLKVFADDKINVTEKWKFVLVGTGRKNCGKRRKCWLPAFSPFPTFFSIVLFSKDVKSRDFVVKS